MKSIIDLWRLQFSTVFSNKTFYFVLFFPIVSLFTLLAFVPINLLVFVVLSLNVNILGYFIYGIYFFSIDNTVLEKELILSQSSRFMKDLTLITFSFIVSLIGTMFLLFLVFIVQLMGVNGLLGYKTIVSFKIKWKYVWYKTLIVYILVGTFLSIAVSYFITSITTKEGFFFIGLIFLFFMLFSSGAFVQPQNFSHNEKGEVIIVPNEFFSNEGFFKYIHLLMPQYYLNHFGALAFRISSFDIKNLETGLIQNLIVDVNFYVPFVSTFIFILLGNFLFLMKN